LSLGVEVSNGTDRGGDGDFSKKEVRGRGVGEEVILLLGSVLMINLSSLKDPIADGLLFTVFDIVVENILKSFEN